MKHYEKPELNIQTFHLDVIAASTFNYTLDWFNDGKDWMVKGGSES